MKRNSMKQHLKEWMPLYEVIGHIGVLLAVIVSVIGLFVSLRAVEESSKAVKAANDSLELTRKSVDISDESIKLNKKSIAISNDALILANKSLKTTEDAFKLQNKEFKLRNRPLIVLTNPRIFKAQKKPYTQRLEIEIRNISDVPANNVTSVCDHFYKRKNLGGDKCEVNGLIKDQNLSCDVYFEDHLYKLFATKEKDYNIICTVTYSGMFGEKTNEYQSEARFYYSPDEQFIKYFGSSYR